jgi:hypothetical protein
MAAAKTAKAEPNKSPAMSKTLVSAGAVQFVYTLIKAIWPDVEIPQDVLVYGLTLLMAILRFVTKGAITVDGKG